MNSSDPVWIIALMGMGITFAALALVMVSMWLLARAAPSRTEGASGGEDVAADIIDNPPADVELPVGATLEEVAAAAVAVAAAHSLALQRRSAQIWLSPQPRSLISPWQLASRDRQLDRMKQ